MKLNNTIIYLLGFAGVGKLTIAKELAKITGAKVVDNHLINNPVFHILDNDGIIPLLDAVWAKTRAIRSIVIEAIQELSPSHLSFIFTNELFEKESHHQLFQGISDLANARNAKFLCVRLLCDKDEIARRIESPTRREMLKAINPSMAKEKFDKYKIIEPMAQHVHSLDITKLSANEAALEIIRLLALKQ
ncbi:MAG: hypothetical protein ACK5WS_07430 [Alphaproteobacteria bacterium]|jgi:deoxyadenosine/deoxycytidine kinase|nr:AAA family ATPase [Candidatus Jidaibacter sp.]